MDRPKQTHLNPSPQHQSSQPRVILFTSPKAGSGAGQEQLTQLIRLFEEEHLEFVTIESIGGLKDAISTSAYPIVVAVGGDGTLALAAGLVDPAVPIVPMPMGTENLLARHFGHRPDARSVLRTIRFGQTTALDVGVANGKPFLIMATSGFDAEVVRGMHLTRTGHISRLSYLSPIARALRTYSFPEIQISVDGGPPIAAGWAMVFNLPCYAISLAIEPSATGNDGLLDLIAMQGRSLGSGLRYLAGIKAGRHQSFSDIVRCRGKSFQITASTKAATSSRKSRSNDRVPFQIDGDYAGRLPLTIETLPGRIRLLLPPVE